MTRWLRKPCGTMSLWPIQSWAALEMGELRGLFASIRVSGGKTLITGIAPTVLDAKRPLLIVPANMIKSGQTEAALEDLRLHWYIPRELKIVSYSKLGTLKHADFLEGYAPDLIIADEAQKIRNIYEAACAIKVRRYLEEINP